MIKLKIKSGDIIRVVLETIKGEEGKEVLHCCTREKQSDC
jgi:hypothetical protein